MIQSGRDGWLFLTEGTNDVASQYGISALNAASTQDWVALLSGRSRRMRSLGVQYLHVIVPEKITIYDNLLGDHRIDVQSSPANRLRQALSMHPLLRRSHLDLVALLRDHRHEAELYHRTDSHYAFAGRNLVYRALCARLDVTSVRDFRRRPYQRVRWTGDLGMTAGSECSEVIDVYAIQKDARRIYASPIVLKRERDQTIASLHSGAHVVYVNDTPSADPRSIVVFGDSNSHFQPTMLTIMLAETFRSVHFIWSTSVDWKYIQEVDPDIVMTQIAERFMARLPNDDFDLRYYAIDRYGRELFQAGHLDDEIDAGDIERFDAHYYLSINADVASRSKAYRDREAFAEIHYRAFGVAEGRHPNLAACLRAIRDETAPVALQD